MKDLLSISQENYNFFDNCGSTELKHVNRSLVILNMKAIICIAENVFAHSSQKFHECIYCVCHLKLVCFKSV
jgi:hypothetical protein